LFALLGIGLSNIGNSFRIIVGLIGWQALEIPGRLSKSGEISFVIDIPRLETIFKRNNKTVKNIKCFPAGI
jgi:hypothetical protein